MRPGLDPPQSVSRPASQHASRSGNLRGGAWMLADMSLNIWALTIVKATGLDVPAVQLVFLRAIVGLLIIVPWIVAARRHFVNVDRLRLHAVRIALSTTALTCGFFALPRMPFALYSALQFTRPVVLMALAALLLHERIGRRPKWAAVVAFVGVLVAVRPGATALTPELTWGLLAAGATVFAGTGAIIATRALNGTPTVVMMTAYTAGLAACTAPFAIAAWVPPGDIWPLLLAVGALAQGAQLCFLRAHARAEASFLAMASYLSLPLTAAVGWAVFGEVPGLAFALGASLILLAALAVAADRSVP